MFFFDWIAGFVEKDPAMALVLVWAGYIVGFWAYPIIASILFVFMCLWVLAA